MDGQLELLLYAKAPWLSGTLEVAIPHAPQDLAEVRGLEELDRRAAHGRGYLTSETAGRVSRSMRSAIAFSSPTPSR